MQTSDSLATIRQAHEGMVPPLERLLTDALGREVEVTATEACRTTFGAYVESLGPSFWSYRFHVQHRDGWAVLAFSPALCAALVNPDGRGEEAALFQAPPHNESIGAIPGPEGEMWVEYASVIARLVKTLVPVIETAWEPVRELQVMDVNLQTGPMSVSLNGPADPAIQVVFGLACQGQGDLALSLCYPLSVAEPSESASYT